MCGIAGMAGPNGVPLNTLRPMGELLAHRGPDGQRFAVATGGSDVRVDERLESILPERRGGIEVGFVHRRLTIIDLTDNSAQPMCARAGRVSVITNSEYYNYRE